MNQQNQTAVVVAPKREIRVVEDESPAAYMLDTAKFEHCYRLAEAMSRASLLPKHLKGANADEAKANCFLVVNQAMAWRLNPFLIMGETYEVQGKLGFQGKLVISVMNTRAGLREKLSFEFNGEKGDALAVTVSGRFIGEDTPRTVTVSVGQAKTSNQMWLKDPEQKLIYTAAIRWARRYAPEVVMGVMIEEDLDTIREEAHVRSLKQAKAPVFEGPQVDVEKPSAPPKPVEEPSATQEPAPSNDELKVLNDTLLKLCSDNEITADELLVYLRQEKWMKPTHKKWTDMSITMLKGFIKGFQHNTQEIVKRIKQIK